MNHYVAIADLFVYPDASFLGKVRQVLAFLKGSYSSAAEELELFYERLPKNGNSLEDLFIRSFDVQAITTLDIGFVLYGDDYKRGSLLANLNREHKNAENDCGTELADHLPNILRLISKLGNEELTRELVEEILVPALHLMLHEFDPEKQSEKNKTYQKQYKTLLDIPNNAAVYRHALEALLIVLKHDFHIYEKELR